MENNKKREAILAGMKSSDLLEYFGISLIVTLIFAGLSFLFSKWNHYFLSRMGFILLKIAAVLFGIMLLIYLSEFLRTRAKSIKRLVSVRRLFANPRIRTMIAAGFGILCGAGVFIYFYPRIASFTWLTWFFAAVLVFVLISVQFVPEQTRQ
jgi:hypothetical protein